MGQGFDARLALAANPATFDTNSLSFDFLEYTVATDQDHLDSGMMTGSRTRREDRSRSGIIRLQGQLVVEPSYRFLDFMLPYILGAAESTDTFDVADALPAFDALFEHGEGSATALKHVSLYVNRMSLRFAPGLLRMTLDLIGKTETTGQTYTSAAIGAGIDHGPMAFWDTASGITIQAATREIDEGELVVDNQLEVLFRNATTAQQIKATDRIVTFGTTHPATSTVLSALYGDPAAANCTIVLARSTMLSTITLYNMKAPRKGPVVNGKGETKLGLVSTARGDSTNNDIKWVNDPVI
jgi:hypothetical protein